VTAVGTLAAAPQSAPNAFAPTQLPPLLTDGSEVYRRVTKGYEYTEGYHFLMKFLTERFVHIVCILSRCPNVLGKV
jgi:hypothetical protein